MTVVFRSRANGSQAGNGVMSTGGSHRQYLASKYPVRPAAHRQRSNTAASQIPAGTRPECTQTLKWLGSTQPSWMKMEAQTGPSKALPGVCGRWGSLRCGTRKGFGQKRIGMAWDTWMDWTDRPTKPVQQDPEQICPLVILLARGVISALPKLFRLGFPPDRRCSHLFIKMTFIGLCDILWLSPNKPMSSPIAQS
jgi:hypothetical protein